MARPLIMGHRGCGGEEPENTLRGIRSAIEKGVDAVEMDVRLTADGKPAVIHDSSVDRTTNGTGLVSDLRYDEILKLDAGKGEKVPLLDEVLEITRPVELFVEIKRPGAEETAVAAINDSGRTESVIVKSFNHRVLRKVGQLAPSLRTACLIEGLPINAADMVRAAGAETLSLGMSFIDRQLVEECQAAGQQVAVWTVNTLEDYRRLAEMGVDYIITDVPGMLLKRT